MNYDFYVQEYGLINV